MSQTVPSPELLRAIAGVLSQLAVDSEAMGEKLCADANVVERHIDRLQDIDRITQSLRELSTLIVAQDVSRAIADIRLGDLQRQLLDLCAE